MEILNINSLLKKRKITLKDDLSLYFLGDFHIGSPNSSEESLRKQFKKMEREENCFYVLMGDTIDCIIPTDTRFNLRDVLSTEYGMIDDAISLLSELVGRTRTKCLGIITGNHYLRYLKQTILDFKKRLCSEMEIPYLGLSAILGLRFRNKLTKIHVTHGWTGGRTLGVVYNNLYSQVAKFDCDIFVMGHSHKLGDAIASRIVVSNNKISNKYVLLIDSGSFLNCYSQGTLGYGEQKQFSPNVIGCAKLCFNRDRMWVEKVLY